MIRRDRLDATAISVVILLCALWGVQQVATKLGIAGGLPPLLQAALRSWGAALLVCAWIGVRQGRQGIQALFRRDASIRPGLLIAMLFAAEFLCLYPGLRMTTASRAVLFLYTAPFFTAFGAHLFLPRERLSLLQVLGLLIAFGGVAIAFADGLGTDGGSLMGDLLCLAAGGLWGATTVVVKASPGLGEASSAKILLMQLGGSAPILLLAAAAAGEVVPFPQATALAWAFLFYQTVIVAFMSYLAWFWLVVTYPASRIAGFTFLTPLFGIVAGAALLGEHASAALVIGLVAIAIGLRMVNAVVPRNGVPRN